MIVALLLCILLVLIIGPEAFLNLLWGADQVRFLAGDRARRRGSGRRAHAVAVRDTVGQWMPES